MLLCNLRWLALFTLGAAFLCPIAMRWLDEPLALWVQRELSAWQVPAVQGMQAADWLQDKLFFGLGVGGWLVWLSVFLVVRLVLRRPAATLLLVVMLTRLSSEAAANVLKVLVHRPRPGVFLAAKGLSTAGLMTDSFSFPSSHTAAYFSLLLPAATCFPRYRAVLLVLPVLVAVERIVENAHYLSDVLGAIALAGALSATLLSLGMLLDRRWRWPQAAPAAAL